MHSTISATIRAFALCVGALLFAIAPAAAQPPAAMPGMPGAPSIPQTELTDKAARGALDAYLAMEEEYGEDTPAIDPRKSTAQAYQQLEGLDSIVKAHGFSDTGDWHTAMTSLAIAYGFARGNEGGKMDKSLAEIKNNPQIPDSLKQQMMATITALRPSENNLTVVRGMMADKSYATKLEGLR